MPFREVFLAVPGAGLGAMPRGHGNFGCHGAGSAQGLQSSFHVVVGVDYCCNSGGQFIGARCGSSGGGGCCSSRSR